MNFQAKIWKGASNASLLVVPKALRQEFKEKYGDKEKVIVTIQNVTAETTTQDPA